MLPLRPLLVMGMVKLPGEKAGGVCEIIPIKSSAPQPIESLRGMLPLVLGMDTEPDRENVSSFSRFIATGNAGGKVGLEKLIWLQVEQNR